MTQRKYGLILFAILLSMLCRPAPASAQTDRPQEPFDFEKASRDVPKPRKSTRWSSGTWCPWT